MTTPELHRAIETVWRLESAKVIASIARVTRDVGVAEELAQDAFLAALDQWPVSGIPANPAAWLTASAKHRAIDYLRRARLVEQKHALLARSDTVSSNAIEDSALDAIDDDIGDELLRLLFVSCHPLLSTEARVALTLRLLGGLSTNEIARAFLNTEATIAQRIVRAKRTLSSARVPFEVPRGEERTRRLNSVMEVIYLIFNEGYSATAGDDLVRPGLCEDALRLGRVLANVLPNESEVHALVGLMELHASRLKARTDRQGAPVLLMDQDRSRWDRLLIQRGLRAVERATQLATRPGAYLLQASIAACHARAPRPEATDWDRIVMLYDALAESTRSPVVELNRAVALSMTGDTQNALELVDALTEQGTLTGYHLLWATRGDLLEKLGRNVEAAADFTRAATLTSNARESALLATRAKSLAK